MIGNLISSFAREAAADFARGRPGRREVSRHLREAEEWLVRAHNATLDGGVSYGYSVRGGWRPSYYETSGYIATTFFDLAKQRGIADYRERALVIAGFLLDIQNADGSFSNRRYSDQGIVFDTGQDLFGLVRAFEETRDERFLDAARRAGDWLVKVAAADRRWTRYTHLGVPHVYNARVAWALLRLHAIDPVPVREEVARANLDWAISQHRRGYFEQCAFKPGVAPFTHTIAYAIRGLLESGRMLEDTRYLETAETAARAMTTHMRYDGFIPGQVDTQGRAAASYCCLTGNCQLAIIWYKIFQAKGEPMYRDCATKALDFVMSCQDVETSDLSRRGGIKGSFPIWGRYAPFSYPNWAAKFFIDAMLLRQRCAIDDG